MSEVIVAVRGAVTVDDDGDEAAAMIRAVGSLMEKLREGNGFLPDHIVSIQFTQTDDLRKKNAAASLREACPEYSKAPLFCAREPDVEGMLPRTVRILVTWRGSGPGKPAYLGGAAALRPDLIDGE